MDIDRRPATAKVSINVHDLKICKLHVHMNSVALRVSKRSTKLLKWMLQLIDTQTDKEADKRMESFTPTAC